MLDAGGLADRCISAAEIEQSVQAELGRVVFAEPAGVATLEVRVRIVEDAPARFRAVITSGPADPQAATASNAAERELEATGDCRTLDEQLALVVALLVDADPVAEVPEPLPAAPEPEPPSPPVQDTSPVSSAPSWESAPAGPWNIAAGALGVVGFGLLPHTAVGLAIEGTAAPPAWPSLRLRAVGFLPGEAVAQAGSWLEITWVFSGLSVCPKLASAGRFTLGGCLGADVTFLHIESHGLSGGKSTLRVGGQASASLVASLALGASFRTVLEGGTSFPFSTERYTVGREGRPEELYRTPFGPALLSLGVIYDFR